jgi:hypothetical protein
LQWWIWVHSFTHRQLKFPDKDRAMAIFGLAQYLARRTNADQTHGRRYLAGLWEERLAASLLWLVHIGSAATPLGEDGHPIYRAPSWSWISVDGGIANYSSTVGENSGIVIDDVHAIRATASAEQTTGDGGALEPSPWLARGSYIELRGRLRPLRWASSGIAYYYCSNYNLDVKTQGVLSSNAALGVMPIASQQKVGPRCYPMTFIENCNDIVGWFVPDTTDILSGPEPELHCLQIKVEPEQELKRRDFKEPWVTRGIALRRLPQDGEPPAYVRVGYFELEKQSHGVYLPMDAVLGDDVHHPLRVSPDIDPYGVFRKESIQSIRLY